MSDRQGADNNFEQILLTALESWHLGPQRRDQLAVDRATLFDSEQIHTERTFEHGLMRFDNVRSTADMRDSSIGRGKQVIVDAQRVCAKELRAEIGRRLQWHVTTGAVFLRALGIIKAFCVVPGNAAQQKRVVMVLATQEVFI